MRVSAAMCSVVLGLMFGIPGVVGLARFAGTGEIWTFMGFKTYGGGPFERWGLPTSVPLLAGFVAICVAEVGLGLLILGGAPAARGLSLALLPFETTYWIGFALPFGPPLGIARTLLLFL